MREENPDYSGDDYSLVFFELVYGDFTLGVGNPTIYALPYVIQYEQI